MFTVRPQFRCDNGYLGLDCERVTPLAMGSTRVRKAAPEPPVGETARKSTENLREKMCLFYGTEDEELIRAIKIRDKWGTSIFSFTKEMIDEQQQLNSSMHYTSENVDSIEFLSTTTATDEISETLHEIVVNDYLLQPHEVRRSEVSTILNAGGAVLSMDWNSNFFVVSIVPSKRPIDISAIADLDGDRCLILVYEFKNGDLTLKKSLTANSGLCVSLKFRYQTDELLMLCSGGVCIVDIAKAPYGDSEIKFRDIQADIAKDLGRPTCVCWRTSNQILVGYFSGHIVELEVARGGMMPTLNFVIKAHDSAVVKISSAYPLMPNVVLSSGVEGFLVMHNTNNIRDKRLAPRMKFHSPICFFCMLTDSFVTTQDADVTKLVPARNPQCELSLTRHESCVVTSGCASQNHPFIIIGDQNGSIKITNTVRSSTVTSRKIKETHHECYVWRLECSEHEGKYRYIEFPEPTVAKRTRSTKSSMHVFPTSVTISDCKWSPNDTWFAAGSAAGLIRFDNVDA